MAGIVIFLQIQDNDCKCKRSRDELEEYSNERATVNNWSIRFAKRRVGFKKLKRGRLLRPEPTMSPIHAHVKIFNLPLAQVLTERLGSGTQMGLLLAIGSLFQLHSVQTQIY
jgi:hypothetical protein